MKLFLCPGCENAGVWDFLGFTRVKNSGIVRTWFFDNNDAMLMIRHDRKFVQFEIGKWSAIAIQYLFALSPIFENCTCELTTSPKKCSRWEVQMVMKYEPLLA
jgi:hypothetical protein